jgi:hypothetical protein
MQVRHQAWLISNAIEQVGVGLHGIDRGQPQALQVRHVFEDFLDQRAERRCIVTRDIDAGEHHFAIAVRDEAATCATTSSIGTEREFPRP